MTRASACPPARTRAPSPTTSARLRAAAAALLVACGGGGAADLGPADLAPADYCALTPLTCSGHGTCVSGASAATCACAAGYGGDACAACAEGYQDNDGDKVCSPNCATAALSCGSRSVCSDKSGTAACGCLVEFAGANCGQCATPKAKAIYLYLIPEGGQTPIGGRSGSDARAATALPASLPGRPAATYRARGFLSMTGDAILDFPTSYCVPAAVPVYGARATGGAPTLLANSWADFMDGTIAETIGTALGFTDTTSFWSGSTNTGAASGQDCGKWSVSAGNATVSNRANVKSAWLSSATPAACSAQNALLGVAYCVDGCP